MILVLWNCYAAHTSCWKCKVAEQKLPLKESRSWGGEGGVQRKRNGLVWGSREFRVSLDWKLATWIPHIISFIFRVFGNDFRLHLNMQIQFRPQLHKVKFLVLGLYWTFACILHIPSLSLSPSHCLHISISIHYVMWQKLHQMFRNHWTIHWQISK